MSNPIENPFTRTFCPWLDSYQSRVGLELGDFCPYNQWSYPNNGIRSNRPSSRVVDETTSRKYLNDDLGVIRIKLLLTLTLGGVGHLIAMITTVSYRALRCLTLSPFWLEGSKARLEDRAIEYGENLGHIILAPIVFVMLEVVFLYGVLLCPRDGRKLYASFERLQYEDYLWAPCFQPDAKRHLFGGSVDTPNSW